MCECSALNDFSFLFIINGTTCPESMLRFIMCGFWFYMNFRLKCCLMFFFFFFFAEAKKSDKSCDLLFCTLLYFV